MFLLSQAHYLKTVIHPYSIHIFFTHSHQNLAFSEIHHNPKNSLLIIKSEDEFSSHLDLAKPMIRQLYLPFPEKLFSFHFLRHYSRKLLFSLCFFLWCLFLRTCKCGFSPGISYFALKAVQCYTVYRVLFTSIISFVHQNTT